MSSSASATATAIPHNSTFVGNTPSAVLFFLAMAVGVAIAALFIFFTIRYFVRSRYGLHIYSLSNRGMLFAPRAASRMTMVAYSDREIYEHLDYLRTHHFLRDDFLERRIYTSNARRRRRNRRRRNRRRGRFSKMKKLTAEEVEKLFPPCSYAVWLQSDNESVYSKKEEMDVEKEEIDVERELEKSDSQGSLSNQTTNQISTNVSHESTNSNNESSTNLNQVSTNVSSSSSNSHSRMSGEKEIRRELHFDSGLCSICLELFEPEDTVRGLMCGHVYHSDCVDPWLIRRRACCPICKRDYYSNEAGQPGAVPIIQDRDQSDEENRVQTGDQAGDQTDNGENVPGNMQVGEGGRTSIAEERGNGSGEGRENGNGNGNGNENGNGGGRGNGNGEDRGNGNQGGGGNDERSDHDSIDDLNYEYIRGDSNIQALFNELVPISERVRVILDEHPDLNLETRARDIARRKYGAMFKRIFWRIMGISRDDLYYWAVLKTFQQESRRESREAQNGNEFNEAQNGNNDTPARNENSDQNGNGMENFSSNDVELQFISSRPASAAFSTQESRASRDRLHHMV